LQHQATEPHSITARTICLEHQYNIAGQQSHPLPSYQETKRKNRQEQRSGPLAPDAARELDVLGHDGDPLGVNGAEVGVLEEPHQVRLGGLLQRRHRRRLEPQVRLEVLRDLPHQPLEGELPDEQLRALLVLADLTERDGAGAEPVRLLHAARGRCRLACRLGGQLLPRRLAAGRLARRLLRAGHRSERAAVGGARRLEEDSKWERGCAAVDAGKCFGASICSGQQQGGFAKILGEAARRGKGGWVGGSRLGRRMEMDGGCRCCWCRSTSRGDGATPLVETVLEWIVSPTRCLMCSVSRVFPRWRGDRPTRATVRSVKREHMSF